MNRRITARHLEALGVSCLLGACVGGTTPSGRTPTGSEAPQVDVAGRDVAGPDVPAPEVPVGLHHLVVGYEICAIDEAGALWCHRGPTDGWNGDQHPSRTPWLRRVPGVPPLATLESGQYGHCGMTLEGHAICLTFQNKTVTVEAPGKVKRVTGELLQTHDDKWHLIYPASSTQAKTATVPALDGVLDINHGNHQYGWLVRSPGSHRLMYVSENGQFSTDDIKRWMTKARPLPFLDALDEVVASDVHGRLAGCAVGRAGQVRCWDNDAKPLAHHPANGRGRDVVFANFVPYRSSFCVATEGPTVCASPEGNEPEFTVPFMGARELAASGDTFCALDESPGIACLKTGLSDPSIREVPAVEGVRVLSSSRHGFCAVTHAGALVCWGTPFERKLPSGDEPSRSPFPKPTTVVAKGVTGFRLGVNGRAWCLTTKSGTRCEGNRWPKPRTFEVAPVFVSAFGYCTLAEKRLRCEAFEETISPSVEAAMQLTGVTAFGGSPFYAGCVAVGSSVSCFGSGDALQTATAPSPVRTLAPGLHGVTAWLTDGTVVRWSYDEKGFSRVTDATTTAFVGNDENWCGIDGDDLICQRYKTWTREPAPPNVRHLQRGGGVTCLVDGEGTAWCRGSGQWGADGQPWSATSVARLPLRLETPWK